VVSPRERLDRSRDSPGEPRRRAASSWPHAKRVCRLRPRLVTESDHIEASADGSHDRARERDKRQRGQLSARCAAWPAQPQPGGSRKCITSIGLFHYVPLTAAAPGNPEGLAPDDWGSPARHAARNTPSARCWPLASTRSPPSGSRRNVLFVRLPHGGRHRARRRAVHSGCSNAHTTEGGGDETAPRCRGSGRDWVSGSRSVMFQRSRGWKLPPFPRPSRTMLTTWDRVRASSARAATSASTERR
jgi:hypothetical protein